MAIGSSRLGFHSGGGQRGYQAPLIRSSRPQRGRPRFDIGGDQLQYLSGMGFSWANIARLLGVSRMTVYRRRRELGMTTDELSPISDEQLERQLTEMRRHHPHYGETLAFGHLRSKGYKVSHSMLRQAIRATDPINTALRWPGGITSRQPYSVPRPNSLWHIGRCGHQYHRIYELMHTPLPTHTHTHTCTHSHTHTRTHTCTHAHAHGHRHTCTLIIKYTCNTMNYKYV